MSLDLCPVGSPGFYTGGSWNLVRIWKMSRFVAGGVKSQSSIREGAGTAPAEAAAAAAHHSPGAQLMHARFVMTKRIATKQNAVISLVI